MLLLHAGRAGLDCSLPLRRPQVIRDNLKKGEISRDQLAAHAFLLVVAGNATVASMINLVGGPLHTALSLAWYPRQLSQLPSHCPSPAACHALSGPQLRLLPHPACTRAVCKRPPGLAAFPT